VYGERKRKARCFEDCEKKREELRTTWSNRSLVGLWRIISLIFLTFLNLWIFVLLLACKGDFMYTSYVLGCASLGSSMK